ncbi:MAG: protein kinase domain-containing protein, partial [Pyrinomonadaceae bacterium]
MMDTQRWQQIKEIFNSALQYEPVQRSRFLFEACKGDDSLREEVESLIASHEKEGGFIDAPAYEVAAELLVDQKSELKPGQAIGSYEVISFISCGGMGEVYLAQDRRLRRKVALKILPASFTQDSDRLQRFEQEARSASALNHPNIITIYEILKANSTQVIATEFVEGETLRQRLSHTQLSLTQSLLIAIQIADALVAAHAAGIIHRDIKPENIMLRPDGYVKVLDFGLAKLTDRKETKPDDSTRAMIQTSAGIVMGTVSYMSPEQARGLPVDERTDIWSLGVVLYEMLAGRAPFEGTTTSDVIVSVLEREPRSITGLAPETPEGVEWIVTKALTKERDDRYQTAREMLSDIRRLKQRLDLATELQRSGPPEVSETSGEVSPSLRTLPDEGFVTQLRNHWVLATLSLVILAGVLLGIYELLTRRQTKSAMSATEVLRTTQIPTPTGLEIPALSPDGNSIAYSSGGELYVKPLTPGAREIQLTSDAQGNSDPAWSPDGRLIGFSSGKRGGIWVIPASGGTVRQVTNFGAWPAWSPDGSLIAFQSEGGPMPPTTIWTVSSQGGDPIQITQIGDPPGGHSLPAWSPDGKRLAFVSYDGVGAGQLWTIVTTGRDLRR